MDKYMITGGNRLSGKIEAQSAKNSILALLAGSVLTTKEVIIHKCPKIADVYGMIKILQSLNIKVTWQENSLIIDSKTASCQNIPPDLAKELRSSIFLLGPIIARFKKATVARPGGCDIGLRPIDLHIEGLKALNVKINCQSEIVECDGANMKAADVHLNYPSVGATENIMMATVFLDGITTISNAAREPEIVDLQNFINAMGGKISGAGTSKITIEGVKELSNNQWVPIPDRIEVGTFLIGTAMTGGEIEISNCRQEHIYPLITKLRNSACKIWSCNDKIYLVSPTRLTSVQLIETLPHPGFPTDLQAPIMAMQTISNGTSVIIENLFETRFKHIDELKKMGADIIVRDKMAIVKGVGSLSGAEITAQDLRGGAALVLAGLAAKGKTIVDKISHIERGYEGFDKKLNSLGADIKKI